MIHGDSVLLYMFNDFQLRLVNPEFNDPLTASIVELEAMRKRLRGSTSPELFFDLKHIFQIMESFGSSRIEGNRTTIADLIDAEIEGDRADDEQLLEIRNIQDAARYVEQTIQPGGEITHTMIQEVHRLIVDGLTDEGDPTPGAYRQVDVSIQRSEHKPPSHAAVRGYLDELLQFMHDDDGSQYVVIRTALAHHRFAWIHPFRNGNGRVVRILHYAMLIQQDFNLAKAGIINPSAVFFADRDLYYDMLAEGDKGTDDGLLDWTRYVVQGLQGEMGKIEKLLDHEYLQSNVLVPAIRTCAVRGEISKDEEKILLQAVESRQVIAAKDVQKQLPKLAYQTVLRRIKSLRDKGLLKSSTLKNRCYRVQFSNNALMRSVVSQLRSEGFFSGLSDEVND